MLVRNVGNYQSARRNITDDLDLFEGYCEDDSDSSTLKMESSCLSETSVITSLHGVISPTTWIFLRVTVRTTE